MALLGLSNELLDLICSHCDRSSIKNLRLTNKKIQRVADRHLVREIVLYYNQESLDLVQTLVTKREDVTKGIQSLWFQADRLAKLSSSASWDKQRKKQFEEHPALRQDWWDELQRHGIAVTDENRILKYSNTPIPKDYLFAHRRNYVELVSEQTTIDSTNALRESAEALYNACPHLSGLWITYGHFPRENTTHRSAAFRKGLIFPVNNRDNNDDEGIRAPIQLLLAASDADRKLDTVVFGSVHYHLLSQPADVLSGIASIMKQVKHFQWDIGETFSRPNPNQGQADRTGAIDMTGPIIDDHGLDNMQGIFRRGRFLDFLANCANLRTLVLSLPDTTRGSRIDLTHLVGRNTFPHLESCHLTNMLTNVDALKSFLLRHKDTLKRLRLCDFIMSRTEDDSWPKFFMGIAGKLPRLEVVCLRGFFDYHPQTVGYVFGWTGSEYVGTRFANEMENYVLTGIGDLPKQKDSAEAFASMSDDEKERMLGSAAEEEIKPLS